MTFSEEALVRVLALDKAFKDTELFHVYLGPSRLKALAKRLDPARACADLRAMLEGLPASGLKDEYPDYRRTYARDFIVCVLAQADAFIFRRRRPFAGLMTELLACPPPGPFDLDRELARLRPALREQGYSSIADYNARKPKIRFGSRRRMTAYVRGILDEVSSKLASRCRRLFPFSLKPLFERSRLRIVEPGRGMPPCFYHYDGACSGTVAIALQREFSESYIRGFVLHELVPGHHLYYLLKQRQVEEEGDPLVGADTYHSPENPVNEGLAVCSDRIFGAVLDSRSALAVQVEKFLHRTFYNAWHAENILRRGVPQRLLGILRREAGFGEALIRQRLGYHNRQARFYTPVYPLGIHLVEEASRRLDPRGRLLLYRQHSANTLKRLLSDHARAVSR